MPCLELCPQQAYLFVSNGSCSLVWMEGGRPHLIDHDLQKIQGLIFLTVRSQSLDVLLEIDLLPPAMSCQVSEGISGTLTTLAFEF